GGEHTPPATKLQKDGMSVSYDGSHTGGRFCPRLARKEYLAGQEDRQRPFDNIDKCNQSCQSRAKSTQHVCCAGSAAAVAANIHAPPSPNQDSSGKRAAEISKRKSK